MWSSDRTASVQSGPCGCLPSPPEANADVDYKAPVSASTRLGTRTKESDSFASPDRWKPLGVGKPNQGHAFGQLWERVYRVPAGCGRGFPGTQPAQAGMIGAGSDRIGRDPPLYEPKHTRQDPNDGEHTRDGLNPGDVRGGSADGRGSASRFARPLVRSGLRSLSCAFEGT